MAFVVSVVHDVDTIVSHDAFPVPDHGAAIPAPPVEVVAGA